ncbi:uncharacterized protein LOC144705848 [Wolffia australiana]
MEEKGEGKMEGSSEASRGILLHNAVIVTVDSESRVFRNGGLFVMGDKIAAIGQSSAILCEFSDRAAEILDLQGFLLVPGFVNTHVHTSQQLGRGIADDVDLITWLHERIWPYESSMTEEDSYLSTLLCGIELIRSGVTCFAEAGGQHVSGMAKAVTVLGIRGCLTKSTMDSGEGLPETWKSFSTEECIQSQLHLYERHHNSADGRIRVWFGIRQIMNATDHLLLETRDKAMELGTGIHMHVSEIAYENQHVMSTRGVEYGTVTYLEKMGLLRCNLLAAHSVWITDAEIRLLSNANVKVSHCPAAAMRMLGFAPVKEMIGSGVCVSIGTDGAPSNNRMSIIDEMYLASLINKGRVAFSKGETDPTAMPSETILRMATINGAKSVLWDNEIGSLEVGKKADIVVVNPFMWTMAPVHDWISNLVYSMRTENIDSVMCNGQWVMRNRVILNLDEGDIIRKATKAASKLLERAGIAIPARMNVL